MTDDPIGDELHRLAVEFRKLLDKPTQEETESTRPEHLLRRFGLTITEAKAWLENEPNYKPSDENLQRHKSDKDFTEPTKTKNKKECFHPLLSL